MVVKRWSEGTFSGFFNITDEKQAFFASTVDALNGSSGGPIISSNGFVVSLVGKGVVTPLGAYTEDEGYYLLGPQCAFFKSIRDSLGI
jgi:hypothetical protein